MGQATGARAPRRGGNRALALGVLVAVAALAHGAPARAASSFAIEPVTHAGYFVLGARPGATVSQQVRVINTGHVKSGVSVYPVDATTGQTSGAVYQSRTVRRRDVGAWIRLAQNHLTLAAGASAVIGFTVRVPRTAFAGQHLGGLVAEPAVARVVPVGRSRQRSFRVRIQEISIVAVQVNTPGPARPSLTITSAAASGTPGYQTLLVGLANRGNVLFKGQGTVAVYSSSGRRAVQRPVLLDTFVPRTAIRLPVQLPGRPLKAGRYSVTVSLRYAGSRRVKRTFAITVSNRQVAQTYGFNASSPGGRSGSGSSGPSTALIAGGAVALVLVSIGGSALFFRARGKPPATP